MTSRWQLGLGALAPRAPTAAAAGNPALQHATSLVLIWAKVCPCETAVLMQQSASAPCSGFWNLPTTQQVLPA